MTYDLKFTLLWERNSIRWLLRMKALHRQLAVFIEMIQSWPFFLVFLRSTSQNYTCQLFLRSNAWDFRLVMTEISVNGPATSEDFWRISEDFRTLPKIKCPQMFPKTFEHFRSYLKDDTFSVLWYDFVRIQKKDTKSSCVKNNLPGFVSQAWETVLDEWYRCL